MRPKKNDNERRAIRQTVNFSEKEFNAAKTKADRLGVSFAEYLRISAVKLRVKEPNKDYAKLLAEMGKIGSNLNQIAKSIHYDPSFTSKHEESFKIIYATFLELKNMIENE